MSAIAIDNSSDFKNLDLTKISALQQKRTLAFINQFVMSTVQFMNDFAKRCEYRLMDFEKKLEKVEADLILLETKLSSIPELDSITLESTPSSTDKEELPNIQDVSKEDTQVQSNGDTQVQSNRDTQVESNEDTQVTKDVAPSSEYDRFVKMVQVGVPLPAVKLKLSLEGLDPNVFDKVLDKKLGYLGNCNEL